MSESRILRLLSSSTVATDFTGERYAKYFTVTDYPANTQLLKAGLKPDGVWLLQQGIVKQCLALPDGTEKLLTLHSTGYWVAAMPALLGLPSVHHVSTATRCTLSFLPLAEFDLLLQTNSALIQSLLSNLAEELMSTHLLGAAKYRVAGETPFRYVSS